MSTVAGDNISAPCSEPIDFFALFAPSTHDSDMKPRAQELDAEIDPELLAACDEIIAACPEFQTDIKRRPSQLTYYKDEDTTVGWQQFLNQEFGLSIEPTGYLDVNWPAVEMDSGIVQSCPPFTFVCPRSTTDSLMSDWTFDNTFQFDFSSPKAEVSIQVDEEMLADSSPSSSSEDESVCGGKRKRSENEETKASKRVKHSSSRHAPGARLASVGLKKAGLLCKEVD